MATVHELTNRERAIARAYAAGQDIATIAAARGEGSDETGETLIRLFGLNRGTAREAVRQGQVNLAEGQAPPIPRPRTGRPPAARAAESAPKPAAPAWPETTIDADEKWISDHGGATAGEQVLAEYGTDWCDACRWPGPASEHEHPCRPVVVRVIDLHDSDTVSGTAGEQR